MSRKPPNRDHYAKPTGKHAESSLLGTASTENPSATSAATPICLDAGGGGIEYSKYNPDAQNAQWNIEPNSDESEPEEEYFSGLQVAVEEFMKQSAKYVTIL